jgi:hypothetical protein
MAPEVPLRGFLSPKIGMEILHKFGFGILKWDGFCGRVGDVKKGPCGGMPIRNERSFLP